MNTAVTRPPTPKDIEATAAEAHRHIRQASDLASLGDYRLAHTAAERAQGSARHLKELLGTSAATHCADQACT